MIEREKQQLIKRIVRELIVLAVILSAFCCARKEVYAQTYSVGERMTIDIDENKWDVFPKEGDWDEKKIKKHNITKEFLINNFKGSNTLIIMPSDNNEIVIVMSAIKDKIFKKIPWNYKSIKDFMTIIYKNECNKEPLLPRDVSVEKVGIYDWGHLYYANGSVNNEGYIIVADGVLYSTLLDKSSGITDDDSFNYKKLLEGIRLKRKYELLYIVYTIIFIPVFILMCLGALYRKFYPDQFFEKYGRFFKDGKLNPDYFLKKFGRLFKDK